MTQLSPTALEAAAKQLDPDAWDSNAPGADDRREDARIMATAAITAYLAQAGKEGWVMVPKEASEEVVNAALDKHAEITPCESPFGPDGYFALLYRAMVAAAQNEPVPSPTTKDEA